MAPADTWLVEMGVASLPKSGEPISADRHFVRTFDRGEKVLVAVIDGLGHGTEAAIAADEALNALAAAPDEPLRTLFERCATALRRTGGVAMSLVAIDGRAGMLTWLGVGNVEAVLMRAERGVQPPREYLIPQRGVVGRTRPALRERVIPIARNDVLALATDGVNAAFCEDLSVGETAQRMADRLLTKHGTRDADALVLVVRYSGWSGPGRRP